MADVLTEALGGLQTSPLETGYGIATQALAQGSPGLITPYTSPGAAVGIGLGSVLLQSLLGYQARQSALNQSLETNSLANQMLKMQTPEERTAFIKQQDVSPVIGSRLSNLATALTFNEQARKLEQANKLADLTTAAQFEMSDLGQQVQKNKAKQAIILAGVNAGRVPVGYEDLFTPVATPTLDTSGLTPELAAAIKQLPPHEQQKALVDSLQKQAAQSGSEAAKQQKNAVITVQDLEKTFRDLNMTAAEFKVRSAIPGDKAELAFSKLKGSLAALARVSGQTSQLSDVDLQQQMDAIIGPKVPGLGMISGTDSIADRLKQKLQTGNKLATQAQSPDDARKEQLRKQIAEMKALLAQRQK